VHTLITKALACLREKWNLLGAMEHIRPDAILDPLSLSILIAIFPGGRGLAGTRMSPFWILFELWLMEVVVATGAINRRAKLQPDHHQQTNTQLFTGQTTFLAPTQQCHSTEGNPDTTISPYDPCLAG